MVAKKLCMVTLSTLSILFALLTPAVVLSCTVKGFYKRASDNHYPYVIKVTLFIWLHLMAWACDVFFDVTQLKFLHYLRNSQQWKKIPFFFFVFRWSGAMAQCVQSTVPMKISTAFIRRYIYIGVVNSLPLSSWLLYNFSSSAARLVSSGIWTEK